MLFTWVILLAEARPIGCKVRLPGDFPQQTLRTADFPDLMRLNEDNMDGTQDVWQGFTSVCCSLPGIIKYITVWYVQELWAHWKRHKSCLSGVGILYRQRWGQSSTRCSVKQPYNHLFPCLSMSDSVFFSSVPWQGQNMAVASHYLPNSSQHCRFCGGKTPHLPN